MKLVRENIELAEPDVKPIIKPEPTTKPGAPNPIRRIKPSVTPTPKAKLKTATAEEVANKFISLIKK
jgi:hypothetical protein